MAPVMRGILGKKLTQDLLIGAVGFGFFGRPLLRLLGLH
jgi:hypothetical protein